jgi:ParB family chromosome partitioning protein
VDTKTQLDRELDALLAGSTPIAMQVAIDHVKPNPHQPRKLFDDDELTHLADSIKNHGVLQPLVVRQGKDGYELIAGERRLRAAQRAGLRDVPVRIVDFNDQQVVEAALVENIQRSDLNPIEKAQGFKEYLDRFSMKTEQLAERLGLDRTTISN